MAWTRIDDTAPSHSKFIKAGPAASWLWVCGNCYASKHLTDGFLDHVIAGTLLLGVTAAETRKYIECLVAVRLWHEVEGGYLIHEYHEKNAKAVDVKAELASTKRTRELYSSPELVTAIRSRDRDCCRFCGVRINWKDRRGPTGGQFSYLDSASENSMRNIVVACRGCNRRKGLGSYLAAGLILQAEQPERRIEPVPGKPAGLFSDPAPAKLELVSNQVESSSVLDKSKSDLDAIYPDHVIGGRSTHVNIQPHPIPSHPIPSHPGTSASTSAPAPICSAESDPDSPEADVGWMAFLADYPSARRSGGFLEQQGYLEARHAIGHGALMAKLAAHKRSEDWKKGFVPAMKKYFADRLWLQEPDAVSAPGEDPVALARVRELREQRERRTARDGAPT